MFARGLKTNIIITMGALLLVAMLLTDLVVTMKVQQDLTHSESEKGFLLLSNINRLLKISEGTAGFDPAQISRSEFSELMRGGDISCVLLLSETGNNIMNAPAGCEHGDELYGLVRRTLNALRPQTKLVGESWGVFWKQRSTVLIAAPLMSADRIVAGAGIALPLRRVHQSLRHSQKMIFVYIFINAVILTLIGLYRLSRVYLHPIRRLVNRAEEYRDEDDAVLFMVRKGDNELNKLSTALNRMMKRIAADKEKLRATVASIERANLDLKQAQNEIIRAEKLAAVGRLSAGIAHEIGNPIGIVMGYLELLRQGHIPESEKNDYLVRTENEINRINTIIRQLLDLARPVPRVSKTISVHGLIEDMAHILRVQPLMSRIQLNLRLSAGKDEIRADPDQVRQVFLNLAINAADALASVENNRDGRLDIQTEILPASTPEALNHRETLKVMFEDNGPGIPPEHLADIFDPFFTTKDPGKGTGLGLSVSFMIIEGIGGTIQAASREGQGTTLTVYLPLHHKESAD